MGAGVGRRWGLVAGSAAAVLAVLGAVVVLGHRPDDRGQGDLPPGAQPSVAAPRPPDPVRLIPRDGDSVEGSGLVVAAPGKPVMFCPPLPTAGVGTVPGQPEPPPECDAAIGVRVTGVDLGRLFEAGTRAGVRFGWGTLRGTWRQGTVAVTAQGQPAAEDPIEPPDGVPPGCAPPAGGWHPGSGTDEIGDTGFQPYLDGHADQLAEPYIAWPHGFPSGPTDSPAYTGKVNVMVVPVVSGDVDRIRADLTRVYAGNLCVVQAPPGRFSQQHTKQVMAAVDPLMTNRSRIYQAGGEGTGRVEVRVSYLDRDLYAALSRVGLDNIVVVAWLHPTNR